MSNSGFLACYDAKTGDRKYRKRASGKGGYAFSASLVAADGKLYFSSEKSDIFVAKAGAEFELITKNKIGEICMAAPAISDGMIFIRGQHHVYSIGRQ